MARVVSRATRSDLKTNGDGMHDSREDLVHVTTAEGSSTQRPILPLEGTFLSLEVAPWGILPRDYTFVWLATKS